MGTRQQRMDHAAWVRNFRHRALAISAAAAVLGTCSLFFDLQPAAFAQEAAATTAPAAEPAAEAAAPVVVEPAPNDGVPYPISALNVSYASPAAGFPAVTELLASSVELTETSAGWVAPRVDAPRTRVKLDEIGSLSNKQFYSSAIVHINQAIVRAINARGLAGVRVEVSPKDVDATGKDIRGEDKTLHLTIRTAIVTQMRTIAGGERIEEKYRINNQLHQRIKDKSPISDPETGQTDSLRKDLIDAYLYRLNRHPGRRVDAAVSPAGENIDGVTLDYLITENKPWSIYAQLSNTGTNETDNWRQRFGFSHNQLTDNDDILTIDYSTASFDTSHTVQASYEAPLADWEPARWKIFGSYNTYTADDVGLAGSKIDGEGASFGAEVPINIYQDKELFLDLVPGLRWEYVESNNSTIGNDNGNANFVLPSIALRLERFTDTASTAGSVSLEGNILETSNGDLDSLGTIYADETWPSLNWDISHSFFLEPLIDREGWEDLSTPEDSTLAHEVALGFRGQYAFEHRLPPTFRQTVGGLYTVRGYDESLVSADSVLIGSAEYRFHIPRIFSPEPTPGSFLGKPFRWAPQNLLGRPDWDLILKAFVDVGHAMKSDLLPSTEYDETLIGVGLGVEFLLKRNVSIRVDYGWGVTNVANEHESGDGNFHIVATFLY